MSKSFINIIQDVNFYNFSQIYIYIYNIPINFKRCSVIFRYMFSDFSNTPTSIMRPTLNYTVYKRVPR